MRMFLVIYWYFRR